MPICITVSMNKASAKLRIMDLFSECQKGPANRMNWTKNPFESCKENSGIWVKSNIKTRLFYFFSMPCLYQTAILVEFSRNSHPCNLISISGWIDRSRQQERREAFWPWLYCRFYVVKLGFISSNTAISG